MRLEHSDCGSGALERYPGLEFVRGELHRFVRAVRSAIGAASAVSVGTDGRSAAVNRDRETDPIEIDTERQRTDAH